MLTTKTKRLWQVAVKTDHELQAQILTAYHSSLRDCFGTQWRQTWQENPNFDALLVQMDDEIRTYLIDQEVQRGKIKRWLTAAKKAALFGVPFREGRYMPIDKLRKIKKEMDKRGGTQKDFHAACRKYIKGRQETDRENAVAKENILVPHFADGMSPTEWSIDIMGRLTALLFRSSKGFKSNAKAVLILRKAIRQMQHYLASATPSAKVEDNSGEVA